MINSRLANRREHQLSFSIFGGFDEVDNVFSGGSTETAKASHKIEIDIIVSLNNIQAGIRTYDFLLTR
jgi:hypothetical protein